MKQNFIFYFKSYFSDQFFEKSDQKLVKNLANIMEK